VPPQRQHCLPYSRRSLACSTSHYLPFALGGLLLDVVAFLDAQAIFYHLRFYSIYNTVYFNITLILLSRLNTACYKTVALIIIKLNTKYLFK
jgi:hypothetical protein